MKPIIESYLDDIEILFIYSPVVSRYFIREQMRREREGYIRIRAQLSNGDIFEAFEFVAMISGNIRVLTYRLQWQTADGQLKKREKMLNITGKLRHSRIMFMLARQGKLNHRRRCPFKKR